MAAQHTCLASLFSSSTVSQAAISKEPLTLQTAVRLVLSGDLAKHAVSRQPPLSSALVFLEGAY